MAREGSKRQIAIDIMKKYSKYPMDAVVEKISQMCDIPHNSARAYYIFMVRNDLAPGKIEAGTRGRKLGQKNKSPTEVVATGNRVSSDPPGMRRVRFTMLVPEGSIIEKAELVS